MPRIPEAELERIKTETDLVALIQSRGVALKKQGANWTGLCPFHKDTQTPNLIVTPGKGLFRCMAACCGKTGNAIQFVQWHDGISFRHACEVLSDGSTQKYEQTGGRVKQSTVPKLDCPLSVDADESELLSDVAGYYHERLSQNPAALEYLKARGLDDEELLKRFKVGLADGEIQSSSGAVSHSNHFVLLDRQARVRGYYRANNEGIAELERDLRYLAARPR